MSGVRASSAEPGDLSIPGQYYQEPQVKPVTEEDLPGIISLEFECFAPAICGCHSTSRIINIVQGSNTPENQSRAIEKLHARMRAHEPGLHLLKGVVHEDGRELIAAYAMWKFHSAEDIARSGYQEVNDNAPGVNGFHDSKTTDPTQHTSFFAQNTRQRLEIMQGKPHWHVMYVCTHPNFRGRGLGTALLRWGMQRCEETGTPGFLGASTMGKPLYAMMGWVERKTVVSEGDFGQGWERIEMIAMVYEPKKIVTPGLVAAGKGDAM